jgi:hypothetical protein
VIGVAATVASGNFTVRVITVSSTFSPNASTTRSSTSRECSGARVVHRREDAVELDGRVQPVAHLVDRLDQQGHSAKGEVLALERDHDAMAGGERIDGEQAERRLAVDEDDVVVGGHTAQHAREDLLAGHLGDEVHLGGRQVDVRRDHVEPLGARVLDRVGGSMPRESSRS